MAAVISNLVVLFLVHLCTGNTERQHQQYHDLDRFIKHNIKCNKVAGMAVSLVQGDNVVFSRGYGHTNVEKGERATEHSEFCIGSLTKSFTSTLIADILSKQDRWDWDTPIRDILGPTFHLSDRLRTDHVTLRDLLAHKVGIPSNFNALLVGFPANMTRAELVRRLQYMPATSEFRTKFHYSNYMYMLAGYVAEEITKTPWETLVNDRLIRDLKMHSTGFVDKHDRLEKVATPYVLKNGTLSPLDKQLLLAVSPSGPAGSVTSTASDMAKWLQFHLRRGRLAHGTQLVNETFLNETYSPQMTNPFSEHDLVLPIYPISDNTVSYNMGWMSSVYRGYRKLWHSGGIVSFTSQMWLFPDMRSGVFVTSNGPISTKAVHNIASYASDLLLGLKPWLNASTTCTYPAPWQEAPVVDLANEKRPEYRWNIARSMSDYVGIYGNMGFGEIKVMVHNEHLQLEFGRFGVIRLQPVSETQFSGYYVDKLWFITNSDGYLNPYSIEFDIEHGKVTQLYFPIDDGEKPTLFLKGGMHSLIRPIPTSTPCYSRVSASVCDSGANTVSSVTAITLATVLVIIRLLGNASL